MNLVSGASWNSTCKQELENFGLSCNLTISCLASFFLPFSLGRYGSDAAVSSPFRFSFPVNRINRFRRRRRHLSASSKFVMLFSDFYHSCARWIEGGSERGRESDKTRDGEQRSYCNEVPPVTHDFGTVSVAKLLLEPNLYSGNFN